MTLTINNGQWLLKDHKWKNSNKERLGDRESVIWGGISYVPLNTWKEKLQLILK